MNKTGFKDALFPKQKKNGNYPWSSKSPHYDERSSCYMSQGDDYGVGKKTPIGKMGQEKSSGIIPVGRVNTLDLYVEKIDYKQHES